MPTSEFFEKMAELFFAFATFLVDLRSVMSVNMLKLAIWFPLFIKHRVRIATASQRKEPSSVQI